MSVVYQGIRGLAVSGRSIHAICLYPVPRAFGIASGASRSRFCPHVIHPRLIFPLLPLVSAPPKVVVHSQANHANHDTGDHPELRRSEPRKYGRARTGKRGLARCRRYFGFVLRHVSHRSSTAVLPVEPPVTVHE